MEYRQLGYSGFNVPVLSLGTANFGSKGFFKTWGDTDAKAAKKLVDICLDSGLNFFDTANHYSNGGSEEVLGKAIKGKRDKVLISTKATFSMGNGGPNERGSSRYHLIKECEASLKRLGTDHIDVYFMHGFDALTPVEEVVATLDHLVTSGKVRYVGCSNFSGWHVMKSLAAADKFGRSRYVAYQGYYSLLNRDYEFELMPLAADQGLGTMVWSPLGWGRLTGKIRRGQPLPEGRLSSGGDAGGPIVDQEHLYNVVDVLDQLSAETGRTVPQIALNWLLRRPTVANVIVGARNADQLKQNLGAIGWSLTDEQVACLDAVSHKDPAYPYWHQRGFDERNPKLTQW